MSTISDQVDSLAGRKLSLEVPALEALYLSALMELSMDRPQFPHETRLACGRFIAQVANQMPSQDRSAYRAPRRFSPQFLPSCKVPQSAMSRITLNTFKS